MMYPWDGFLMFHSDWESMDPVRSRFSFLMFSSWERMGIPCRLAGMELECEGKQ